MDKSDYLNKKLEAVEVRPRSISELLAAMGRTGFQGRKLAEVLDVWTAMASDANCTIFMGYAGSLSTTGQWKIVHWLIENRYIDVLVSTGANITEDVFEAMGNSYYQGSHLVDDEDLLAHQIDRYYDVFADELQYRTMENLLGEFMMTLDPFARYSSADFLYKFGEYQNTKGIDSITAAAQRAGVPVFSPAMADSGFGVAYYQFAKKRGLRVAVDQFKDFEQMGDIGDKATTTAVIYVGGGVPKDTIQLIAVMVSLIRGGDQAFPHKYAIQITTDSPQWGGLSGCTFEEAVSWGKIDENALKAVLHADATIALPLVSHGLMERLQGKKRQGPDLGWVFNLPDR